MPKRWAALPRGIRWLAGIAVVVLALAIVWALFVPLADWLAHHDVGSATGLLHETALDNARSRLLTIGAGLVAGGVLSFTARSFALSREGQVTDRYTKAIEQLGSDKLDVRMGGIYALERVARDSARDHPTVMEVLTAFIREHSRELWPEPGQGNQDRKRSIRPDVQAALTIVGRRNPDRDVQSVDLSGAHLSGAHLSEARLSGADLTGADLTDTHLSGADLTGANLTDVDLSGARLTRARLPHARLARANLTRANMTRADLARAYLSGAHLSGAHLSGADLTGAHLSGADLTDANLTDARLTGVNLTDVNLSGAKWPGDEPVTEGWERDPDSGQLSRES